MTLALPAILDAVQSHALRLGWFEKVNGHEPKNAPGNGITAAVWVERVVPYAGGSGLAATTGVVLLNVRLYSPMLTEPQDGIDPAVIGAADALLTAYSGDFELGGLIRNVDLLGQAGEPLGGRAGYLNQDGKLFRVFTINLPLIINDLWSQSP